MDGVGSICLICQRDVPKETIQEKRASFCLLYAGRTGNMKRNAVFVMSSAVSILKVVV